MLTPRIIADLRSGDECADPDHPGLRVRRTNAARVFFYRYRASDGALREIKLGEFGPMTLAEARKALGRLKLEHERGVDGSVSAIYYRHRYDAEARLWLQKWADYLESLTVRNVNPFRAAQQAEGQPVSSRRVPAAPAWASEAHD